MKTTGTPSYLQEIARRPAHSLPLLKPPHVPMRQSEMAPPHDLLGEPSLKPPTQHMAEQQPAFSIEKAPLLPRGGSGVERSGELYVRALERGDTSSMPTPAVPPTISPAIEHGKNIPPPARNQKSSAEIQLAPMRSTESTGNIASATDQPSPAAQNSLKEPGSNVRRGGRGVGRREGLYVRPSGRRAAFLDTQRAPLADALVDGIPQEHNAPTKTFMVGAPLAGALLSGSLPGQSAHITLVPRPPERPAASSQQTKPEAQQQTSIHIGTIEVQIVPASVPPMPLPAPRPTPARQRSTSALSRELTSFIGLRQG